MTWPLAHNMDRAVAWPGDPYINTWILDWDWYATFHHPLSLFQANAFYPAQLSLAYSENLYGIAVLLFPLRAAGMSPLTAYNVAMLAGYAFSGFAAYLLGRHVTGSTWAGIAAGVFYAFLPFRFTHASHVQHVWGGWLPLLLYLLIRYGEESTWKRAALFGAAFLMNGLSNIHALLFGAFAVAATLPFVIRRRNVVPLLACTAAAGLLLLPFLIPYIDVANMYGMQRGWRETKRFSALPGDWLVSNTLNHLYRAFAGGGSADPERWLFPGALCLVIGAFAAVSRPRRPAAIGLTWIVLGFIGSLGTHNIFHRFLFRHVIGFRAIRVPARWAMIAYVGLALLVAIGVAVIARKRRWLAPVIVALFIAELWSAPVLWYMGIPEPPPVYRWIAQAKPRAFLALPVRHDDEYAHMLYATSHRRPMMNGVSGFAPPEYNLVSSAANRDPIPDRFIDNLKRMGCEIVVVHAASMTKATLPWLQRELARGRLTFVDRFDPGDWVFRIGGAPRAGAVDKRLDAFLRGEHVFNETPFGVMDEPMPGARLSGKTTFSGWAMSPFGIREVNLLFNNGLIREKTTLSENPYLNRVFPYYDATALPVYSRTFDKRPDGVWPLTDVQTEIIDGHGRRVLLPDRFVEWQ